MSKCPHCHMNLNSPAVAQIIAAVLRKDLKRDIYEIGNGSGKGGTGKYTVTFRGNDGPMPVFDRETALKIAETGIVYEEPSCRGWFRRAHA